MQHLPSNMKYVGQFTPQSGLFAGQTMPLFEMREEKITLKFQPPESEVFAKALKAATVDELKDCLHKSAMWLRERPTESGQARVQKLLQELIDRDALPPVDPDGEED